MYSRYKTKKNLERRIGIGLTVHNRYDIAKKCIANIKNFMPEGSILKIVDDASEIPFEGSDYRFNSNVGIAKAKNMCFELLQGCDEIFLFDEDCWPIVKDWHLPYIKSDQPHLSFTFDKLINGRQNGNRVVLNSDGLVSFGNPCGCMLYFNKICLEKVGGFDEGFGRYGYDHVNLSVRIFNAGLTKARFLDVPNSLNLFHSMDYAMEVKSSVPEADRAKSIVVNRVKYNRDFKSSQYIPYKQQTGIILTSYFTGTVDPQRCDKWQADINQLKALVESANAKNCNVYICHDCFTDKELERFLEHHPNAFFIGSNTQEDNPYFLRWKAYRHILKEVIRKDLTDNIFMTDCNDVEVLKNPFQIIKPGILYCGWEKEVIGCQWMLNHHKSNFMHTFIKCNAKTPLLNAGVIGGRYEIVMEFLDRLCDMYEILPEKEYDKTDMPLFNWVLYSHFNGRFETGLKVTTEFKAFKSNDISLFKHK